MELRLMSNNLWWCDRNAPAWEARGLDCTSVARAPGFVRLYAQLQPDIIGLQECSPKMEQQVMTGLLEQGLPYGLLWGRDTPILYRTDRFCLVDSDFAIYPEAVPGLEGSFNNLKTKSFCIAVLRHRQTGLRLAFATTHLWYRGEEACPGSEQARGWQMGRLIDRLDALQAKYGCGAVLVGDLNTWPTGRAAQTALERGFAHACHLATDHADRTSGMHMCCAEGFETTLREGGFDRSLDHIFLRNMPGRVRRYARTNPDYYWPLSDHSPLWIDMEV